MLSVTAARQFPNHTPSVLRRPQPGVILHTLPWFYITLLRWWVDHLTRRVLKSWLRKACQAEAFRLRPKSGNSKLCVTDSHRPTITLLPKQSLDIAL